MPAKSWLRRKQNDNTTSVLLQSSTIATVHQKGKSDKKKSKKVLFTEGLGFPHLKEKFLNIHYFESFDNFILKFSEQFFPFVNSLVSKFR